MHSDITCEFPFPTCICFQTYTTIDIINAVFQLYETRSKCVAKEELGQWSKVLQEAMSDEEGIGSSIKVKLPPWRSMEILTVFVMGRFLQSVFDLVF